MNKSLFVLCLIAAGLGMLFSTLTMQSSSNQEQKDVVVLRVVERKADFAYIVRPIDADTQQVYYADRNLRLPLMQTTTITVNDQKILHP